MSLHTFSQAPKEGKIKDESANTQVEQWQTTKEDYLQFLVDNKVVYEAFEKAVEKPELQSLRNTGLERVRGLEEDIAFIQEKHGGRPQPPTAAALSYADYILQLSPQVFVTHFYNYYFAHTAGGRMIGKTVMDTVFGGHLFAFYRWDGDVKELLTGVKGRIDALAAGWTRAERDEALAATPDTFAKSGALLRTLVGKARDRAARAMNKVAVRDGRIVGVGQSAYALRRNPWDV